MIDHRIPYIPATRELTEKIRRGIARHVLRENARDQQRYLPREKKPKEKENGHVPQR